MYPNHRRRPSLSATSSFTSFSSSDNSCIPTYRRRRSPTTPRRLAVHDLGENSSSDQIQSPRMLRPILPIPRPLMRLPHEQFSRTIDRRPLSIRVDSSIPNRRERTPASQHRAYQIVRPSTSSLPPSPPPPPSPSPPPPAPVPLQIVPVPVQQYVPIYTLRQKNRNKYRQEKTPGLCATLCSGGFATLGALVYIIIALALPTAKLVLGIIHINNCNINPNIPLYMIVSGACGLSIVLFLLLSSSCSMCRSSIITRKTTHKLIIGIIGFARGMQGLLAIFLIVWFFIGNAWIFGARANVQTTTPSSANYCHPSLYWFAFYVLIFTYVYCIFMCFLKFCTTFFCCGACDIWRRAFS